MAAMNMQMVARSWFMYELTNSASMLGIMALVGAVPMLSLSLFGGVLADRLRKKNILLVGQLASALVALGVAIFITLGTISWTHLLVAGFLQGVVTALMMPSRQAIIFELVGEDYLMNAIALNASAMNLLRLMAPGFAGIFIALWSIEGVYYMMAGLYFIGFFFALKLPVTEPEDFERESPLAELRDGLRYIRRNTDVLTLLIFTLLVTILSMPYFFLLPMFTKDILTVDVASLGGVTSWPVVGPLIVTLGESSARQGLLISISGVGALVGSLFVASMSNRRRGLIFLISLVTVGATLVIFSLTSSYWLACFVFVLLGLGQSGRMSLGNTLIQSNTEDAYRGRVMSVYMMEFGITFIGVFFVSLVADAVGVQWAVGGAAGILLVIALYYLFFTSRIRNLD